MASSDDELTSQIKDLVLEGDLQEKGPSSIAVKWPLLAFSTIGSFLLLGVDTIISVLQGFETFVTRTGADIESWGQAVATSMSLLWADTLALAVATFEGSVAILGPLAFPAGVATAVVTVYLTIWVFSRYVG